MVSRRYAYVEFTEPTLVNQALALNESLFRGRNLKVRALITSPLLYLIFFLPKVVPKRTNLPGMTRGGRGRGAMRGAGGNGGRGGFGYGRGGFGAPRGGGYRGGFRGRGRGYAPY